MTTDAEQPAQTAEALAGGLLARAGAIISTSSFLTISRIAGAVAGFALQLLLARTLEASALGLFYSITSFAAVAGLIAAQGYPALAPRFISHYREQGRPDLVAAFLARARRDVAICAALAASGTLVAAWLWPALSIELRVALVACGFLIAANAALRLNGYLAAAIRRFALAYLPDTCFRSFLVLGAVGALVASNVTLNVGNVTWLFAAVLSALALGQLVLLRKYLPADEAAAVPVRLIRLWKREAQPLILVALVTSFFADLTILMVTPLLPSAETAAIGLSLKLAMLIGFAVQVSQQLVVPDLADARARKSADAIHGIVLRAFAFPLAVTVSALVVVVLWGEHLLAVFGPEFAQASLALQILVASQVARAMFGPSVLLLTVIGAQWLNASLAIAALVVLAAGCFLLAPPYGLLGAAGAAVIAILFWLVTCAFALARVSGLRTDVFYFLGQLLSRARRSA